MASKEYRCVQRTKQTLQDAFVQLSIRNPGSKITVTQLCEEAGMSRNAFYFHYADLDELFLEIENGILDEMRARLVELERIGFPENVLGSINALVEIVLAHREVSEMLMSPAYFTSFSGKSYDIFSDFNYKYFQKYNRNSSRETFDFYYTFISDGFWGMFRRYLQQQGNIPQEKFTALCYTFIKRLLIPNEPSLSFLNH